MNEKPKPIQYALAETLKHLLVPLELEHGARDLICNAIDEWLSTRILDVWTIEDVLDQAEFITGAITDEEAREALFFMHKDHDAWQGFNWGTCIAAIERMVENRHDR